MRPFNANSPYLSRTHGCGTIHLTSIVRACSAGCPATCPSTVRDPFRPATAPATRGAEASAAAGSRGAAGGRQPTALPAGVA
ncbi:hypothetical protein GTS_42200 [Gandjariella thermophila]|uniref:Uncharacterized protein n=1 Tax=Gandjariella thermophila TaxID=1931992 RepID=A0A4D4JFA5_9PSEU|nr:hypothetical protein GTS_42200 [Gandjariella thermophila]